MEDGIFVEIIVECIECGSLVKKLVLEGSDMSTFLCPICEMGDIDFDDD